MSPQSPPRTVHRNDYAPSAFLVDKVDLRFDLHPEATVVHSKLSVRRNGDQRAPSWTLDGENLTLQQILLDGKSLSADQYSHDDESLTLRDLPDEFELQITVQINPTANKALSGLYRTSGNFCTQCEAQGFRRITFFPDRPDVMSRYQVTIRGDQSECPVMLSNGNRVSQRELEDGRHEVVWVDPHPKPSYLFALVAGDLKCQRDTFTTCRGKKVDLEIWVEERNLGQCDHAMESLKKSMQWDEQVFGLEYDLDIYMVVVVDDFNMGAMENKGLNVFNSQYALCAPATATDGDFERVEAVIAHEYFHNWTGNRVTCRDWFQLTLKEGLTVFRDQQFTADQTSAAVKRIDDVVALRNRQFPEDAGPMAHPIRPESYVAMDNFYTSTVYNKGAEIIRIYHTLLGQDGFRKGMDLYFQRHDNQAVTCDDFRAAMADANDVDFGLMDRWYSQPGTPEVNVTGTWEQDLGTFTLTFQQSYPELPDSIPASKNRKPVPIPVRTGLLGDQGDSLPLNCENAYSVDGEDAILMLDQEEVSFEFTGLSERPTASVLRGFSAPVRLSMQRTDEELAFLMAHDSDSFNRWDAGQTLALRLAVAHGKGENIEPDGSLKLFLNAMGHFLKDESLDGSYRSLLLGIPSEATISQEFESVDPDAIHAAREFLRTAVLDALHDEMQRLYDDLARPAPYRNDQQSIDQRRLKNTLLGFLSLREDGMEKAASQFERADNMTDSIAALRCLVQQSGQHAANALGAFYGKFSKYPLVLDKWFAVQAGSSHPDTLKRVQELACHDDFTDENPNRVRSLIFAFSMNLVRFHQPDGSGYRFLADHVIGIGPKNPQLGARLVSRFNDYRRYESKRQNLMRVELERIAGAKELPKDVQEIVGRALDC